MKYTREEVESEALSFFNAGDQKTAEMLAAFAATRAEEPDPILEQALRTNFGSSWESFTARQQDFHRIRMRRTINGVKQMMIPEGWQMVPTSATQSMMMAIQAAFRQRCPGAWIPAAWKAALAAAPKLR